MSHAATNWAIQQRGLKPTTKIVLWHLADRFNPDFGCFPSQGRLTHDCEISRATLNRHLDDLEARSLIRRIRITDPATGRQRPTRYLLAFEAGFPPPASEAGSPPGSPDEGGSSGGSASDVPCPDLRHGADPKKSRAGNGLQAGDAESPCLMSRHGSVSHSDAIPCLKNGDSRVSKRDTNPVREPLREPVKEEEGAQACAAGVDDLLMDLLRALGLDPDAPLPGWWQGDPPLRHLRRWRDELGLSDAAILGVAADTRRENPAPPDGPKALDRDMERAARRNSGRGTPASRLGESMCGRMSVNSAPSRPTPSAKDVTAFYAELVNSDRFLPTSMISNTIRDAMLASGLVTAVRLRQRGIA